MVAEPPLPRMPRGPARDAAIIEAYLRGDPYKVIARTFSLTIQTVWYTLARNKIECNRANTQTNKRRAVSPNFANPNQGRRVKPCPSKPRSNPIFHPTSS